MGCAAAGVAGDIVGSSIDTTQELFRAGKADTYANTNWQDTIGAMRRGTDKLGLHPEVEHAHPEQLKVIYQDDRKQEVTITIVRRTETMTEVHVDVGFFGPEGLGRLVLREIAKEMPKALTDRRFEPDGGSIDTTQK
jgi:hypothetical protein